MPSSSERPNASTRCGACALSLAPASVPILTASSTAPSASHLNTSVPSSLASRPLNFITPSTMNAAPAMGVRQLPSSAAKNARSQSTHALVSGWLSPARYLRLFVSSSRHWIPMAPCDTAGSISSGSRTVVRNSVISMRISPACANRVASTAPSSNLRRRVCTLPRKFTTLSVGLIARIWHCRRSEADPMTLPSGRSLMLLYLLSWEINTSRVSSRGRLQGKIVPGTSHVGTSFIECTQMSTSLDSRATSNSLVKSPLPPISLSACYTCQ
mmetsp:Transcript_83619/g.167475  ORF Transcript_83619/g.167475 Transcript_83619/m.167475 type:complete len:270 (-) Transcript_83619:34-843(-)